MAIEGVTYELVEAGGCHTCAARDDLSMCETFGKPCKVGKKLSWKVQVKELTEEEILENRIKTLERRVTQLELTSANYGKPGWPIVTQPKQPLWMSQNGVIKEGGMGSVQN